MRTQQWLRRRRPLWVAGSTSTVMYVSVPKIGMYTRWMRRRRPLRVAGSLTAMFVSDSAGKF